MPCVWELPRHTVPVGGSHGKQPPQQPPASRDVFLSSARTPPSSPSPAPLLCSTRRTSQSPSALQAQLPDWPASPYFNSEPQLALGSPAVLLLLGLSHLRGDCSKLCLWQGVFWDLLRVYLVMVLGPCLKAPPLQAKKCIPPLARCAAMQGDLSQSPFPLLLGGSCVLRGWGTEEVWPLLLAFPRGLVRRQPPLPFHALPLVFHHCQITAL